LFFPGCFSIKKQRYQFSSTCPNLCLHFSENGCAKYNGDLKGMENTAVTINENIPGR
jgi:hypothetical protein